MNELEQRIAHEVRDAVNLFSTTSERAEQDQQFIVGPSAIGFCSERLRRQLDRQVPTDEVEWNKAFIGTALGDYLEQAWFKANPSLMIQSEFWVELEGDTRTYRVPAHADVIDPENAAVWDFKAKDGLEYVRRQEVADQGYRFQRHIYALGAWQSGFFSTAQAPEEIVVGNIYYDRSGKEPYPHVESEKFSWEVIREAVWWLDEVVEAFLAGEEATKEPPREMCAKTCGFFEHCRGYDTDVEGVIRDPKYLTAIEMYLEGGEMERDGKKLKRQAQIILNGVEGHTPTHSLRWTTVNGGEVHYTREAYLKMQLTKKKR
jgi:hypothetical protein